jgi:hypothetical protein
MTTPAAPFATEKEAFDADHFQLPAPAERATVTGGTEKQNAYASELRDRYLQQMRSDRDQLVRRRGDAHLYNDGIGRDASGAMRNHTEERIAELEQFIARGARAKNAKFWLNNMAGGGDAVRVSSYFREHPKAAQ